VLTFRDVVADLHGLDNVLLRPDSLALWLLAMGPLPSTMSERVPNRRDLRTETCLRNQTRARCLQAVQRHGKEAAEIHETRDRRLSVVQRGQSQRDDREGSARHGRGCRRHPKHGATASQQATHHGMRTQQREMAASTGQSRKSRSGYTLAVSPMPRYQGSRWVFGRRLGYEWLGSVL
jgi:hypothetical protein